MKDLMIDACRWHVDAEATPNKQRALDHFQDRYTVLLDFLRVEGLLAEPAPVPRYLESGVWSGTHPAAPDPVAAETGVTA
jgi:hypothetical protein